jgi:hypothetical protein
LMSRLSLAEHITTRQRRSASLVRVLTQTKRRHRYPYREPQDLSWLFEDCIAGCLCTSSDAVRDARTCGLASRPTTQREPLGCQPDGHRENEPTTGRSRSCPGQAQEPEPTHHPDAVSPRRTRNVAAHPPAAVVCGSLRELNRPESTDPVRLLAPINFRYRYGKPTTPAERRKITSQIRHVSDVDGVSFDSYPRRNRTVDSAPKYASEEGIDERRILED